jgi:hypothetical protein
LIPERAAKHQPRNVPSDPDLRGRPIPGKGTSGCTVAVRRLHDDFYKSLLKNAFLSLARMLQFALGTPRAAGKRRLQAGNARCFSPRDNRGT